MDNANSPASPTETVYHPNGQLEYGASGLTKREQIAAMAMQNCWYELTDCNRTQHYKHAAESCVAMADALLLALAAGQETV
jgi:hypothetical protein